MLAGTTTREKSIPMHYIKQLSCLAILYFMLNIVAAQPSLRFWGVEATQGDLVYLEFRVHNFTDITRLHIPFFIPTDQLELESIDGFQANGMSSANFTTTPQQFGELVTLDWNSGSDTQGVTLPQGGALFRFGLRVLRDCGVSAVNIWPGALISSVQSPTGINNATVYGGNVNITGCLEATGLAVAFSDAYGSIDDTVCVQVSVENFDDMLAIQYSIEYDANSLALLSIDGFNLPGLALSNFGFNSLPFIWPGSIANSWTDPNVVGLSVPDGTNIYDLCFLVLPNAADTSQVRISQVPTITEAIDGDETVIKLNSLPGRVILGPSASNLRVDLYDFKPADCANPQGGSLDIAVSGGQFPYSYLWSGPDGFTATGDDLSQLAPGQYQLTVTDQEGSIATLTAEVDFNGPVISVSADTTICQGDVVQLNITALPGSTFTWSPVAGLSCADCPNPLAAPAETTAYTGIVTDIQGCTEEVNVSVNVRSYLDFGLLLFSNSPVCAGDTLFFYNNLPGAQSYIWSGPGGFVSSEPEPFIPAVSGMNSGMYNLSVIDELGCTVQAGFEVNLHPEATIQHVVIEPNCFGENAWTLDVSVGGAGPFSYSWNTGAATQDITISEEGEYVLTAGDINGCVSIYVINPVLSQPEPFEVAATIVQMPLCPDIADGMALINATGGTPPYSFSFSNGMISGINEVSDLSAGTYVVSVTDAKGCMAMTSFTLTPLLEQCSFNFSGVIPEGESLAWCSSELTAAEGLVITPGTCAPPDPTVIEITYENDGNCAIITGNQAGADTICWQLCRVSGACVSLEWYLSAGQPGVWPGDTDDNGEANQYDLLPIGLAYGASGPQRNNGTLEWVEQTGLYWPAATPESLTNFAYIDANGDGQINESDTLAIHQNWLLEHNFSPGDENWSENARDGLSFYVETENVAPGQEAVFPIVLGLPNETPVDVYGLAFNLNYDATWVEPGAAFLTFEDSWLGDELLTMQRTITEGKIAAALTRTDGQNQSGTGAVARLHFKVKADVASNAAIVFTLSEIRLLDNTEALIPVNALTTESGVITGITNPELQGKLHLYPNPAGLVAWLEADPGVGLLHVQVLDLTGKVVWAENQGENTTRVELIRAGGLSPGIYLVQAQTRGGIWAERVVVTRGN